MNWNDNKPLPSISYLCPKTFDDSEQEISVSRSNGKYEVKTCLCPKPCVEAQEIHIAEAPQQELNTSKHYQVKGFEEIHLNETNPEQELSPKHYEVKTLSDIRFLRDNIRQVLPNLNDDTLQSVIDRLTECGVEGREDLFHVRESDFSGILKPIPARKLIYAWKENSFTCVTQCSPVDPLSGSVESYKLVPVTDLQNFSVASPTFHQIPQRRTGETTSISMPYIVTVGNSEVPILDATTATATTTTTTAAAESVDHELDNKDWVKTYALPWTKLSSELLALLNEGRKITGKAMREIIRVVAEDIYSTIKRPSPKDIYFIAMSMVETYQTLCDGKEEKDSINALSTRLRNRLNFKRKKELQLSRKMGLIKNWVDEFVIPWDKLTAQTRNRLEAGVPLDCHLRRELIRVVIKDIMQITEEPRPRNLRTIAERMVTEYPDSLQDRKDDEPIGGCESLIRHFEFRVHYINKKKKKPRSPLKQEDIDSKIGIITNGL